MTATQWLNPDKNLHTDMLKQQVAIGEILVARFKKEENYEEAIQLNLELIQTINIIYERSRKNQANCS